MFYIYILQSDKTNKYYIGSTADINERFKRHNQGSNRSTKSHRPWKLIYTEKYQAKADAIAREKQIKSYKGGRAFKALLRS